MNHQQNLDEFNDRLRSALKAKDINTLNEMCDFVKKWDIDMYRCSQDSRDEYDKLIDQAHTIIYS